MLQPSMALFPLNDGVVSGASGLAVEWRVEVLTSEKEEERR
jgi:hypothetical protein